jgi:hypothetical protein
LLIGIVGLAGCAGGAEPEPVPEAPPVAVFYVAPNGDDANPGTLEQPFATVARARDEVRGLAPSMQGDIEINLRDGVYPVAQPIEFDARDSGTNGFRVEYAAYPGERPVISGGRSVAGWTIVDGAQNVWRAEVGPDLQARQFYVDGVKAQRARSAELPAGFEKADDGFTTTDLGMQHWRNVGDIELVGHALQKFYRCPVAGITDKHVKLTQPCWANAQLSEPPFDQVRWIENAFELLDTEGEWYLDRSEGALYYKARPGESMAAADTVVTGTEALVEATDLSNVRFSGITFAYAGWTFPDSDVGYVGLQTGDHPVDVWDGDDGVRLIPAAVRLHGARDVALERNVFAHLGGAGLALDGGSQQVSVTGNKFEDIASNAVNLGTFSDPEAAPDEQNRGFLVANNYITRIGDDYANSSAIWGGYVAQAEVLHNEIFDVPQKGISIGWGWGTESYAEGNRISYNRIVDFTKVLNDSGGIYTLSPQPGTEVSYNYVNHDVNGYNCLYPDEGTAFTSWHHNVCERVGEWLHIWTDSIQENEVRFNYSDTSSMENEGADNDVGENVVVEDGEWPAEARAIIDDAGLQVDFRSIRDLRSVP